MGIIHRIFKTNEAKKSRKKIETIVHEMLNEFSLYGVVKVEYVTGLSFREGRYDRFNSKIFIGIKDTLESKTISNDDWLALKNSIHHELTHAKNYLEMDQSTKEKINNDLFSLTHFAYKIIDEYSAYLSADRKYIQTRIASSEEILQRALKPLWSNDNFVEQTAQQNGFNDALRYQHFVDLYTAIIVHSIRNDQFPSIQESYNGYNKMCKTFVTILAEYSTQLPLQHEEYQTAGIRIWDAILITIPQNKVDLFKRNVGMNY